MQLTIAVIFGVVTGSLYGLAALGLVFVYRATKVLNFALAGTASISAYIASSLLDAGWGYPAVLAVVLFSGAALGALCYLVLKGMASAGPITTSIGTVGILLILLGLVGNIWGVAQRQLPLPIRGSVHLGSISIGYYELLAVAVAVVALFTGFLVVFRTRLGLRMRAVSSGPRTADLLGVNRRFVELSAWAMGGVAGSLAGLLIVPLRQLDQNVLVNFMLTAFVAVVMGGFTSLGGVVTSGIAVGIALNLLSTFVSGTLESTFTFLLIAAVLAFRPNGVFGSQERSVAEPQLPTAGREWLSVKHLYASLLPALRSTSRATTYQQAVRRLMVRRGTLLIMVVVGFAVALSRGGTAAYVLASSLATFIAVLGVTTIVGLTGQVSLGHGAIVGLGAYTTAMVSTYLNTSFWVGLPMSVVVGCLVGAALGWPAARLSGVYLVVFTLAFGLAIPELLVQFPNITGGGAGLTINLPSQLFNVRYGLLLVAGAAFATVIVYTLVTRSTFGRRWRAVRDSELATISLGWSATASKVTAFAFGSALAAFGGAMQALLVGYVSPDGYSLFTSIYLLVAVYVGGPGTVFGSFVGALIITMVPYYAGGTGIPQILFGLLLLLILAFAPQGIGNRLMGTRPSRRDGALTPITAGSAPIHPTAHNTSLTPLQQGR